MVLASSRLRVHAILRLAEPFTCCWSNSTVHSALTEPEVRSRLTALLKAARYLHVTGWAPPSIARHQVLSLHDLHYESILRLFE
jgi:hypothetical protein